MNAVACLAGDMNRLDVAGRKQFEPFFREAARIQGVIRALIDACMGKDAFRQAVAPLFEYPLIPEGAGQEREPDRESLPPSSAQNIVNITLSSLQAGGLAGTLGEAFSGFASQAATLADIYSPIPSPGETRSIDLPWGELSGPPPPETAGIRPATVTGRADSATVLERLRRSASVLHTLESVRTDLTRSLFSQKSTADSILVPESRIQPWALPLYSRGGDLPLLPAQAGPSRAGSGRAEHEPETLGTMFTTLHGMLQKSERMADIPLPATIPMGHPPLPQVPGPGIEMAAPGYPVTAQPLPAAPEYRDRQKKPSGRTSGSPHPAPGAGIIEVPSLVPAAALNLRSEMATVNAARLSEGITRLAGSETMQTALPVGSEGVPSSAIRLSRGTELSSPAASIPDAFEKIAQYITYSSDIHQQFMTPLSGGTTGAEPGHGIFSIPLPFTGSDAGGDFSPGVILQGKDIRSAVDNPVMNLAVNMVAGDVMRRAHLFPHLPAGSSTVPGMYSGSALSGAAPVSSLFSLERALPLYTGSRGETTPPATGGSTTVHFQNTFNITVTTTAKGDERELRELGRKIGVILSDEMKRYGGFR